MMTVTWHRAALGGPRNASGSPLTRGIFCCGVSEIQFSKGHRAC